MDYVCDFHGFKIIFDVLGEVEHMGSESFARGGRQPAQWCRGTVRFLQKIAFVRSIRSNAFCEVNENNK